MVEKPKLKIYYHTNAESGVDKWAKDFLRIPATIDCVVSGLLATQETKSYGLHIRLQLDNRGEENTFYSYEKKNDILYILRDLNAKEPKYLVGKRVLAHFHIGRNMHITGISAYDKKNIRDVEEYLSEEGFD